MLGLTIWIFYAVSLWWFFVTTLDSEKQIPFWERVLAVFPPLATSMAVIGYYWFFDSVMLSRCFAPFWCLSWVCTANEVKEAKDAGNGLGALFAILLAVVLMSVLFGPGLFMGYLWIVK